MKLEEIQRSLNDLDIPLDARRAFDTFYRETGSEAVDSFLSYLHNNEMISDEAYRVLQPEDTVEVQIPGAPENGGEVGLGPGSEGTGSADAYLQVAAPPHHTVLGELGSGAAGVVYLVKDLDLQRKVAYKRLQPQAVDEHYTRSHFLCEAQITAQLEHPNIVPLHAMHEGDDGSPSYTMKFVRGKTLLTIINECRAFYEKGEEPDEAHSLNNRLEYFLKVCDAVAYAHSRGVIHRDLKPENIMVGSFAQVYVMDWGIAKLLRSKSDPVREQQTREALQLAARDGAPLDIAATQMGAVVGSVRYMSPEQATCDNDSVNERSDQYSLGIILHELVAVRPAVEGETFFELLTKVGTGVKSPIEHINPAVRIARELRAIIDKATALKQKDRYESVSEMAEDLRRYMHGEATSALPETSLQRLYRWTQHHRETTIALALFFLLVGTAAVSISVIRGLHHQKEAANARQQVAETRRDAAERIRTREQHLEQFLSRVAEGRNRLDRHFMMVESLLSSLAAAATQALAYGQPTGEYAYSHLQFMLPGKAPPDFAESSHYHRKVSFDWPVFKLAPSVTRGSVKSVLNRIAHLRHRFKQLFLASSGLEAIPTDPEAVRELLGTTGVPVFWAFLGLEQGVMFSYPGKTGYPRAYDPRTRPWYVLVAGKPGLSWGNPYVDTMGGGLLLPSATSLYDDRGTFLGVAGMECTFNYIIENLMTLQELPGIEETFIVDQEARVVVRSSDKGKRFEAGELHQALDLPPFPMPDIVLRVKRGQSGVLETRHQGKSYLVAHYPLHALGWHYVVQADTSILE